MMASIQAKGYAHFKWLLWGAHEQVRAIKEPPCRENEPIVTHKYCSDFPSTHEP